MSLSLPSFSLHNQNVEEEEKAEFSFSLRWREMMMILYPLPVGWADDFFIGRSLDRTHERQASLFLSLSAKQWTSTTTCMLSRRNRFPFSLFIPALRLTLSMKLNRKRDCWWWSLRSNWSECLSFKWISMLIRLVLVGRQTNFRTWEWETFVPSKSNYFNWTRGYLNKALQWITLNELDGQTSGEC